MLSGQHADAASSSSAIDVIFRATGKHPSIVNADLDTRSGAAPSANAVVDDAMKQSTQDAIVSLRWFAPNPADVETAGQDTRTRLLTDYEWKELLTTDSHLNRRWCEEVDAVAEALKPLATNHVAVLWAPYPEPNGKKYWWSNRPGIHGSAELYRMLYDRFVNHHHLKNLVWVWEAVPPGFGPNAAAGPYSQFFPGLLYVDALDLHVVRVESRFRTDIYLRSIGVGKPIGLFIDGTSPGPAFFANETGWAWFVLGSQGVGQGGAAAGSIDQSAQALAPLYADSRVVSR